MGLVLEGVRCGQVLIKQIEDVPHMTETTGREFDPRGQSELGVTW